MASKRLFPDVPHDSVKRLIGDSPFLDLSWHFNIDLEEFGKRLRRTEATIFQSMDFDTFKAREKAGISALAKQVLAYLDETEESTKFEELNFFSDYVVEMDQSVFTANVLVEHYTRLTSYIRNRLVKPDSQFRFDSLTTYVALAPALKWGRRKIVKKADAKQILILLESTIFEIADTLHTPELDADLLEYQNNLIFCYFIVAHALQTGIHPAVVSRHLLIFRSANSSSWASLAPKVRMQYATLVLHLAIQFYPPDSIFKTKLGFSEKTLADLRDVLFDASGISIDAPFTVHQWVFRWFKDKLDTEVFSTRRYFGHAANLAALSDGEQSAAVELCRRFASFRLPITIHHIERFLLQFETTARIRGVLRLLTHCKFFPLWELASVTERLLSTDLGEDPSSRLVVAPLGDQSGSTAIIKYLASHSSLAGRLHFADDIRSALAQTKTGDRLHFVDDCLLSGTQTLNILGDLMGTRKRKPHHTAHCEALSKEDRAAFLNRFLTFSYCVVTDEGEKRFASHLAKTDLDPARVSLKFGILEHSSSKAFESMGPVAWTSIEERDALKQFATDVGFDILEPRAKRKNWDDSRRLESALGFSDFQRLLIFPYNVPKTTVTMLWECGTESRPWLPLFPGFD